MRLHKLIVSMSDKEIEDLIGNDDNVVAGDEFDISGDKHGNGQGQRANENQAPKKECLCYAKGLPASSESCSRSTILLAGSAAVGKQTLASALVRHPAAGGVRFNVRATSILPLTEDPNRPRIDFIVLMIDMTSKRSLDLGLRFARSLIDLDYLFGKSCVVVTKTEDPSKFAFPSSALQPFTAVFEMPVIMANLTDSDQLSSCVGQVSTLATVANGFVSGLNALFIGSHDRFEG